MWRGVVLVLLRIDVLSCYVLWFALLLCCVVLCCVALCCVLVCFVGLSWYLCVA